MQTVKISTPDEGVYLEEAIDRVSIIREGQLGWDHWTAECREAGKMPRTLILFADTERTTCARFLYEGDHAWVMNHHGKTVASA